MAKCHTLLVCSAIEMEVTNCHHFTEIKLAINGNFQTLISGGKRTKDNSYSLFAENEIKTMANCHTYKQQ